MSSKGAVSFSLVLCMYYYGDWYQEMLSAA